MTSQSLSPEEQAARMAEWKAVWDKGETPRMSPEQYNARLAAWPEPEPHDYIPFVKGVMEGRRPSEVWQELHPHAKPASCHVAASCALRHPRVRELLSAAHVARAEAIGRDTVDVVVEYWKRYYACVAKGDEKNARLNLDSIVGYYGGFDKGHQKRESAVQINVVFGQRPTELPSVTVLEALPNGNRDGS